MTALDQDKGIGPRPEPEADNLIVEGADKPSSGGLAALAAGAPDSICSTTAEEWRPITGSQSFPAVPGVSHSMFAEGRAGASRDNLCLRTTEKPGRRQAPRSDPNNPPQRGAGETPLQQDCDGVGNARYETGPVVVRHCSGLEVPSKSEKVRGVGQSSLSSNHPTENHPPIAPPSGQPALRRGTSQSAGLAIHPALAGGLCGRSLGEPTRAILPQSPTNQSRRWPTMAGALGRGETRSGPPSNPTSAPLRKAGRPLPPGVALPPQRGVSSDRTSLCLAKGE